MTPAVGRRSLWFPAVLVSLICACQPSPVDADAGASQAVTDAGALGGGAATGGGSASGGGTAVPDAGAGGGGGSVDGGVLSATSRGIYVLGRVDNKVPVRAQDFVAGSTLRLSWKTSEPAQGQYDFKLIDDALAGLAPLNQHLTIEVFAVLCPAWVTSNAAETWNSAMDGQPEERQPVPWDESAQLAWGRYMKAMADHLVPGPDGKLVPLSAHPTLGTVDAAVVGLQGLRDLSGHLVQSAGYSRQKFIDAFIRSVHASRDVFPAKGGFVGMFGMNDADRANSLGDSVVDRLNTEFNNPGQPSLGLFQELLSDAGPNTSGGLGQILLRGAPKAPIFFQALTAWTAPFTGADKVTSGNPNVGLAFAWTSYRARYIELYVADIDTQAFWPEFRTWATTLTR